MKGYAEVAAFSREQLADFRLATAIVAGLHERQPDGDWVRCHELARAVCAALVSEEEPHRWRVVDGQYGGAQHSWLVWGGSGRCMLDVYAVGELPQVKIVDCNTLWRRSDYSPGERRRDIRLAVFWKLRAECLAIAKNSRALADAVMEGDPGKARRAVREIILKEPPSPIAPNTAQPGQYEVDPEATARDAQISPQQER